jgi:hypothetical protein
MIQAEPNHSFIRAVHHGKLTVSLRTLAYHLGRLLQHPCRERCGTPSPCCNLPSTPLWAPTPALLVQVGLHLLLG